MTGENQVLFGGNHEVLTVTQRAGDRRSSGAIRAAVAIAAKPPGTYEFSDLIG